MSAAQKMAQARAYVIYRNEYFSVGIHSLIPRPVPGIKTMGVTAGMVLYYDPDWLDTIDLDEIAGTVFHEALHVYGDHLERLIALGCDFTDPQSQQMGNIAADLAANSLLRKAGWKIPHGYYPEDFGFPDSLSVEEYWQLLHKNPDKTQKTLQKLAGQSGDGGEGDQQGGNDPGKSDQNNGQQPNKGGHKIGRGGCGGIVGNPQMKELEEELDGELGRSSAEKKIIQQQMANEVREASQGRGNVPGEFLDQAPRPTERSKIPWPRTLMSIATKLSGQIEGGGNEFSMAFPSKRSYVRGIIRPGMIQHKLDPAFILDTSGSMGTKQMQDAVREVIGVMRSMGCDQAWFLQADTRVAAKPQRVSLRDLNRDLEIRGRGGTDFDEALEAAERLKPRPDLIFYMTDGDGSVSHIPRIPVIWVIVNSYYKRAPAPWGKAVFVED